MPEANTHVPHHTQRENDTTNGGGAEGAPIQRKIGRPQGGGGGSRGGIVVGGGGYFSSGSSESC